MDNNREQSRRNFIKSTSLLLATFPLLKFEGFAAPLTLTVPSLPNNLPITILADARFKMKFEKERMVLNDGLQPSMLCTSKGTLIVQSQVSGKPLPQKRIFYPFALSTVVSRDGGEEWSELPLKPGDNGVNIEGGIIQLRDGTILAMETYVIPGGEPGKGAGLMWYSNDDYRTLQGPVDITFNIPGADFYGSSDDGGRPHAAMRLHRRILELPNGDLLTTIYGWLKGDNEPSGYTPSMMKTRVMLFRSTNKGRHWEMLSTVAAEKGIGTEGFGEPVIVRISKGKYAGRLICHMRTGRDLYEAISDDGGLTWSKAKPRVFGGIDVYKTELWAEMFKDVRRKGVLISENPNEFYAAVVDPDLIELRSGILVAAFGVRIPARANFSNPKHPLNGNYLAFSFDHGETWSHVTQMTSGIATTHYMAVEELPKNNQLFVVYDFGVWGGKQGRYTYGRKIKLSFNK
jgi:hypothetical protein